MSCQQCGIKLAPQDDTVCWTCRYRCYSNMPDKECGRPVSQVNNAMASSHSTISFLQAARQAPGNCIMTHYHKNVVNGVQKIETIAKKNGKIIGHDVYFYKS